MLLVLMVAFGSILGAAFGAGLTLWLCLPEAPNLALIESELAQVRLEAKLHHQMQMARHDGVDATVRHASQRLTHGPHGPVK